MNEYDALDDFAGPGGWDEGARMVGLKTLGFEWDQAACDTAEAAGHARVKIDVSLADAAVYRGKVPGYIASPPCTLFSSAGSGVGNLVIHVLASGIERIFAGEHAGSVATLTRLDIYPVTLAEAEKKNAKRAADKKWTQERVEEKARADAFVASLVLEPARRIMELDPEWIALEQVPEVLPLWQVYVRELRARGYSAWTGVLMAADYGVPQTRERAVVMASRTRQVAPPVPTHSKEGDEGDLFGTSREKWVSMARALGWDAGDAIRPARGEGMIERHGERPDHPADEPAPTVISKARSWTRFVSAGVTGEGRPKDPETQPADTLTGKGTAYWIHEKPAPTLTTTRRSKDGMLVGRQLPPGESQAVGGWAWERPATTVVGSFCPDVISAPGYRTTESRQNAEGGVRVTVAEGGVLQSFPADYPWQGSRSKQYQQVGNAVPPRLAAHVLAALTGQALEVVA